MNTTRSNKQAKCKHENTKLRDHRDTEALRKHREELIKTSVTSVFSVTLWYIFSFVTFVSSWSKM